MYDDIQTTIAESSDNGSLTPAETATIKLADKNDQVNYGIPEGAMFYIDREGILQWNGPELDEVNDTPEGLHLVSPGIWAKNSDPTQIQNWNIPLPNGTPTPTDGTVMPVLMAVNEVPKESVKIKKNATTSKSTAKKKVKKATATAKKKSKKVVAKKSSAAKVKARSTVKTRKAVRSR